MKRLFTIPALRLLRNYLEKPKEPTMLEVAALVEELKVLSRKIDIELPGAQRYTFASVAIEEPSTLEISQSKLLLVNTPTASSRPGKAFWSVRTKPAKIANDGEIIVDAKFELEEATFKVDKNTLQTLLAAFKQGRPALEELVTQQYEARMPQITTERQVIAMLHETLRCDVDKYHPYVHWMVDTIKDRTPDFSASAQIMEGIAKRLRDVYSQLHISYHAFSEPRYHTIVKRKIEEGARAAWRNHPSQAQPATNNKHRLPEEASLLYALTGFLFKPNINEPDTIKSAFAELRTLSEEQAIYLPGAAYTDVGNFPDEHTAHLKIHGGHMYVELTKKSKYPTYPDVIPADVSDKGTILGTSKSLGTEYEFEVTPTVMKTILVAHTQGGQGLAEWVKTQQVVPTDTPTL